jgi:hypothetical protein
MEYVKESETQTIIKPKNVCFYKNTCYNDSGKGNTENVPATDKP